MKSGLHILLISLFTLVSCSKTPDYVIDESDMVDLLVDLHKTQSLIELRPNNFNTDSLRDVAKQTVLQQHGFSYEKYDTSLVWYSHNVEIYNKVYEKVLKELNDELYEIDKASGKNRADARNSRNSRYKNYGDTAYMWENARTVAITGNMKAPIIKFSLTRNPETERGDKYTFMCNMVNGLSMPEIFMAIEYRDGSLSFLSQNLPPSGMVRISLQADKTLEISQMYGYITFKPADDEVMFLNDIMLLRTHCNDNDDSLNNQRFSDRDKKRREETARAKEESEKRRQEMLQEQQKHRMDSIINAYTKSDSALTNSRRVKPPKRSRPH